ncbi:MAG TPA: glycosyltransferase family 2 protein [Sumerlaeia bacterium]|nr:glycosyltransferase family 2 protein [Sumerlaeia bacterium]
MSEAADSADAPAPKDAPGSRECSARADGSPPNVGPLPKTPPRVTVIILNWNSERDTIEAVRSAARLDCPGFEILVVDNHSRPASLQAIREACSDVQCVETGDNLGYAGGNNFGLRLALERGADFCLVLNSDVTVDPAMLRRLVARAAADPSLAVLGPDVYRHDDPTSLFYPGWEIDWRRWLFHRVPRDASLAEVREVDYVQGCAMLLRASFLKEHGLFDERYHLYCEDADLCVRARRAGFGCAEIPAARVWHKGYASAGGAQSPLKTYYGLRNRLLFIAKHAPRRNRLPLRAHLLLCDAGGQMLRALGRIARGDARGGLAQARALGRAILDWLRGRYGPGPAWLFRGLGD